MLITSVIAALESMSSNRDAERFRTEADKYAAYVETPEGRLRVDLAFANLQDFLPQATRPLLALDLGGGPGVTAVRLARLGIHVTLLDESIPMLDFAKLAAEKAGVTERIAFQYGHASELATTFPAGSFDLVLCHNVLEFVDNPRAVLADAARVLRDSSSIISVLVRNQPGEVLKAAILNGDLAATERNLTAEWGDESLYGGKVRLFTAESMNSMLVAASLANTAVRGVRVVSDYLPSKISRSDDYQQIFELERKLSSRAEFVGVARYTHFLARPAIVEDV